MDDVYAIIVACGLWGSLPDCIEIQLQGPPVKRYQCVGALLDLRHDFEEMRIKIPEFKDYVIVDHICRKDALPHGDKPREENI